MKQEMIKLNRVKVAHSEEDVQRLTAEGYVPVHKDAAPDPEQQNQKPLQSATDQDSGKPEQPKVDKGGRKK